MRCSNESVAAWSVVEDGVLLSLDWQTSTSSSYYECLASLVDQAPLCTIGASKSHVYIIVAVIIEEEEESYIEPLRMKVEA